MVSFKKSHFWNNFELENLRFIFCGVHWGLLGLVGVALCVPGEPQEIVWCPGEEGGKA